MRNFVYGPKNVSYIINKLIDEVKPGRFTFSMTRGYDIAGGKNWARLYKKPYLIFNVVIREGSNVFTICCYGCKGCAFSSPLQKFYVLFPFSKQYFILKNNRRPTHALIGWAQRHSWRHFHFVLDYRDIGDVTKTRKNLGYLVKQRENSFRESVLW